MARAQNSFLFSLVAAFVLLCSVGVAGAATTRLDDVFGACELAMGPIHFLDQGPLPPKLVEICRSQQRIKSLYLCLKVYGNEHGISLGLTQKNETCQRYQQVALPPFHIIDEYSDDDIARLRHLNEKDRLDGVRIDEVAIVGHSLYKAAHDTLVYIYPHIYQITALLTSCRNRMLMLRSIIIHMGKQYPILE